MQTPKPFEHTDPRYVRLYSERWARLAHVLNTQPTRKVDKVRESLKKLRGGYG